MVRPRASATAIWIKNSCVHMQSPSEVLNKAMQMAREYPCNCKSKAASSLQKTHAAAERRPVAGAAHWPLVPHRPLPAGRLLIPVVRPCIHPCGASHPKHRYGPTPRTPLIYFISVREFFVWPWSFQIYPPTPRMHQPSVSVAKMRTSRPSRTAIHPCICIDARTQHPTPNTTRHDGQFVASTPFFFFLPFVAFFFFFPALFWLMVELLTRRRLRL